MNLISAFLVLLAGTGSDHRLTKWSVKACEEHAGMGKPRARDAIEELIGHGLVQRAEGSTRLAPQYRLPEVPPDDAEVIFLPKQLVTGFASETPVLRRVRETGDPLLLEMLIDLYGMVETDATHGVPIKNLRQTIEDGEHSRKVCEVGVHALWALRLTDSRSAKGDWTAKHRGKAKSDEAAWQPFWDRLTLLERIGALWYDPWAFQGVDEAAEPLMPVDPSVLYASVKGDDVTELTRLAQQAASMLTIDREYLLDRYSNHIFILLPPHHQPPAIRGVARLRVEPDTPGRRMAYARRMAIIETATAALQQLISDINADRFDRPVRLHATREAGKPE